VAVHILFSIHYLAHRRKFASVARLHNKKRLNFSTAEAMRRSLKLGEAVSPVGPSLRLQGSFRVRPNHFLLRLPALCGID